jgi:hypothetical protein
MNSNIDEYGNIGRLSVAHYKPTVTGAGATSNNLASATTVMYPTGLCIGQLSGLCHYD